MLDTHDKLMVVSMDIYEVWLRIVTTNGYEIEGKIFWDVFSYLTHFSSFVTGDILNDMVYYGNLWEYSADLCFGLSFCSEF